MVMLCHKTLSARVLYKVYLHTCDHSDLVQEALRHCRASSMQSWGHWLLAYLHQPVAPHLID